MFTIKVNDDQMFKGTAETATMRAYMTGTSDCETTNVLPQLPQGSIKIKIHKNKTFEDTP